MDIAQATSGDLQKRNQELNDIIFRSYSGESTKMTWLQAKLEKDSVQTELRRRGEPIRIGVKPRGTPPAGPNQVMRPGELSLGQFTKEQLLELLDKVNQELKGKQ